MFVVQISTLPPCTRTCRTWKVLYAKQPTPDQVRLSTRITLMSFKLIMTFSELEDILNDPSIVSAMLGYVAYIQKIQKLG